jgi:hypothetical protein
MNGGAVVEREMFQPPEIYGDFGKFKGVKDDCFPDLLRCAVRPLYHFLE